MKNLLTKEEFRAALAISKRAGGEVRINGHVFPWEPFSVGDYLRYVVARFKSARAFFVMTMEGATLDAQVKAIEATRPLSDEERADIDARREQLNQDYLIANAIDQAQADAATLALGFKFAGDEEVEGWLIQTDPDEFEVALREVEEGSWGQDPERFFGVLGRKLFGRTMQTLATARARTSSSSSDSSTPPRTSSKTPRSPNRKSPRATRGRTSSSS